ncbi:thioester reductase domain-containing protein [Cellulomonas phragmiteti]|uniref:Carrier domain-containing protein n=1 Tax=Cellulomonas phragmiteti TaxID=478780 RepID=A0ABQ4DPD8_9CELL|nr:thioester reductase domain-containing protein [Cellulomonas phragmiteti]GIG41203.1 hypothetical protein Cph01nite_29650 [Cellulomonas phragmiteti]
MTTPATRPRPASQALANDPATATAAAGLRADLRGFLADRLPAPMVPARIVVVDELPKLPNGKVDRGALTRSVDDDAGGTSAATPPEGEVEERAAALWTSLLGVAAVGAEQSFFELGGDSVRATQMLARWDVGSGRRTDMRAFLENPTVRHLAALGGASTPGVGATGGGNPRSVPAQRLQALAVLPDDIAPEPGARPWEPPFQHVLVTGGTGYTGAHLVRELLDRSDARLTVVARAADDAEAAARVIAAMRRYGVLRDGDAERVHALAGDLALPHLDLPVAAWDDLAATADLVVHNGAWSSYALPLDRLRPTNVLGTEEVLRLAAAGRPSPVHYVSSLAVYPGVPGAPRWDEDAPVPAEGVVGGYRQSKWVGDSLVEQAHRRGIPTARYRPGQITGSQATGACDTATFLNAMIRGCIQLGASLDFDVALEVTPVDYCSAALAHLALDGGHTGHAYNLPGARPLTWADLTAILGDYGYPLPVLPYPEWHARLRAAVAAGDGNELEGYLPLFSAQAPEADLGYEHSAPDYRDDNTRAALAGSGITCAPPDLHLWTRYLDHFVDTGFLPAPTKRRR